jgi:hypothetical protein
LYQITAVLRPEFAFDPKKKRPPSATNQGGRVGKSVARGGAFSGQPGRLTGKRLKDKER